MLGQDDKLTYDEAIQCLEAEINHLQSEKRHLPGSGEYSSVARTPPHGVQLGPPTFDTLDFAGPLLALPNLSPSAPWLHTTHEITPPPADSTEGMQMHFTLDGNLLGLHTSAASSDVEDMSTSASINES